MASLSSRVPTLYDETHRGIEDTRLEILSWANEPTLIAYLEHYDPSTDGSFAVCIASGNGNFISQKLYNSIPEEHRPQMEADNQKVTIVPGQPANTLGKTFIPILLTNANGGERFRIVLRAYIMERSLMGMFISHPSWIKETSYKKREHICDFGEGNRGKGNVVMLSGI